MPRRLAAIVAGDISGYSRLMQIDEEGTHNRVKRIERVGGQFVISLGQASSLQRLWLLSGSRTDKRRECVGRSAAFDGQILSTIPPGRRA